MKWGAAALVLLALASASCRRQPEPQIGGQLPQEEHGLHYTQPAQVWDEALPLGNGLIGALIWGDGQPLRISLDRADLWDLRPIPEFKLPEYRFPTMLEWHREGKVKQSLTLFETPYERPAPTRIRAGRLELQMEGVEFLRSDLELLGATASMEWKNGARARFLVHATDPVGLVEILDGKEIKVKLVAPDYSGQGKNEPGDILAGDPAQLGYEAPEWREGERSIAFVQPGWNGFSYAVYVAWYKSRRKWQAAWSVASSFEGSDPLDMARRRAERALNAGFDRTSISHTRWWKRFWNQSSITIPNSTLERQWYLDTYKFGAASRRGAPPISLQAIWTADHGKLPPWKGDYHHDLNTELSYWPAYSGNHLNEGLAFLDYLWATRDTAEEWTKQFFEVPGMNVPMTADLAGRQMGGWRQYTHSPSTAAWLAHHFYLHWRYSGDREFLYERAYPYLRQAAVFVEAYTATRGEDGKRTFPLSSSPELFGNAPEAWFEQATNYDVALARWLMRATAELAGELHLDVEAKRWRRVLDELPELAYEPGGPLLVTPGMPLPESHRHLSHLMAIHPLGLLDRGDSPKVRKTIEASLDQLQKLGTSRWTGYTFAWLANLAARARQGERAERALEVFSKAFCLRNSFHANGDQSGKGYSRFTYRPVTLEGNFAAAAGVQEMLLQSHHNRILIFPAIPDSWSDVSFYNLRAEGAFLVSAERVAGLNKRVEIYAERDGRCIVTSPFSGKELSFPMRAGERRVLTPEAE